MYFLHTESRPALWHTHLPIQWVLGALSQGVKLPGREANHSTPSSADVKNAWSATSRPSYILIGWYLIKHRARLHSVILS